MHAYSMFSLFLLRERVRTLLFKLQLLLCVCVCVYVLPSLPTNHNTQEATYL